MQLSDGEKLIIVMLADIYGALAIQDELDPVFIKDTIYAGQTWALKAKYPGVFEPHDTTDAVVSEVGRIMTMWTAIEYGFEALSEPDRAVVMHQSGIKPQFRGFDGNNESEYMAVAEFFVEKLARFANFKGRDFNSHAPSLAADRRMLTAFDAAVRATGGARLTRDQLVTILAERVHPDNR